MRSLCLEEGILQSYLDGELPPSTMETVASHLAFCMKCAEAAREAELENALFSTAMSHEFSLGVPTERLRERLEVAIAEQRVAHQTPAISRLRTWLGTLASSFSLQPRYAGAFASLAVIALCAGLFVMVRMQGPAEGVAQINLPLPIGMDVPSPIVEPSPAAVNPNVDNHVPRRAQTFTQAKFRKPVTPRINGDPSIAIVVPPADAPEDKLLPGEKSYLKAIARLTTAIKAGGDTALRPTVRFEYERNLAVVNQAIDATRSAARRNPNDPDATEFLLLAYQSKVDLLNTVAEQARVSTVDR